MIIFSTSCTYDVVSCLIKSKYLTMRTIMPLQFDKDKIRSDNGSRSSNKNRECRSKTSSRRRLIIRYHRYIMAAKIQFLVLLCVSALFTSGFADTIDVEADNLFYETGTNISSLVDAVLPSVREHILEKGMDPMKLDNIYQKLPSAIVRNRVINLTNGWLQGLSNIHRAGDAILTSNNDVYTVDATLGFDILDGTYDYLFQDSLITRRGQINGRFISIDIKVVADVSLRDRKVLLRTVKIVRVDRMSITFKGHTIDWVVNLILKNITNRFRNTILSTVEKQAVVVAQRYIDKLIEKLPLSDEFMVNNNILKSIPTSVNFVRDDSFSTDNA